MEELPDRIGINPRAMAGKPVTRGTGITVDSILELLAAGMRPEEIAGSYKISIEDARAAMLYAAFRNFGDTALTHPFYDGVAGTG